MLPTCSRANETARRPWSAPSLTVLGGIPVVTLSKGCCPTENPANGTGPNGS